MPTLEIAPGTISREIEEGLEAEGLKAPPRPKFSMIEHDRIQPSPLNPRKHFAEDGLAELAESLRVYGMQQPLVVRQHVENQGAAGGVVTYSIVMGERRWRAAALAGMLTVPAIVRTDLDDLRHAELAMEENVRRRDLSVMEEANGYAKLQELGKTQTEIGAGVGVSQSRIANLLRLRELPPDVQQMIEGGQLSTGHGISLARYKAWPDVCRAAATRIIEKKTSVREAEQGLRQIGTYDMNEASLLVELSGYPHPAFDWKAICPTCPFGAYLKEGNSQAGEHHYCLKPSHATKLDKEAKDEQRRLADIQAHRMREEALQRTRQAEAAVAAATTKTGAAQAQTEADAAAKASAAMMTETGKPKLSKTQYGVIEEVYSSAPAECHAGTCPCRCMAFRQGSDTIVPACADPKRQAKLKQAAEKEKNKGRKSVFDDARAQLAALPWDNQASETQGRRMMAMVAWNFLRNCKNEAKKQVAGRLRESHLAPVRELLLRTGYEVQETKAFDILAGISPTDLLGITAEAMLRDDLLTRFDYGDVELAKTKAAWFLPAPDAGPDVQTERENVGTSTEPADAIGISDSGLSTEPRIYPCADCKTKDAGAFYVDPNGYEVDKRAMLGEWVCLGCQEKRKAAAQAEQTLCANCEEPLTTGAFESAIAAAAARQNPLRMNTGELLLPDGRAFCEQCGPTTDAEGKPKNGEEIACQDCGETGHWLTRLLTEKGVPTGEFHPSMLCSDCRSFYPDARACTQCKFIRTDFEPDDAETCLGCRVSRASERTAQEEALT